MARASKFKQVSNKRSAISLGGGASGARDLKKAILAILGLVAIYRLGSFVPIPFVDALALHKIMQSYNFGVLNMFNTMSGGSLGRLAIFALGVIPYISASIIMQIATHTYKTLQDIQAEGPKGTARILFYTRIIAFGIALIQGWAIAANIGNSDMDVVTAENVQLFNFLAMITFATGSMVLIWLGDSITKLGFGSGISIIIYVSIISNLPSGVLYFFELTKTGAVSPEALLAISIFLLMLISGVIMIESGRRVVDLQYPGNRLSALQGSNVAPSIPIKINVCGVMPAIFGSVIAGMPALILGLMANNTSNYFLEYAAILFAVGSIGYSFFLGGMIALFAFYYIPIAFKAESIANNLKKRGAFIPGYRPGESTAIYLESIVYRLMVFGSIYLVAICVMPQIFVSNTVSGIYFGGTSVLIAVSVSLDLMQNLYSNMIMQKYDKLMQR